MFPLLWAADSCLYALVYAFWCLFNILFLMFNLATMNTTSKQNTTIHTLCSVFISFFAFMLKHFYTGEYDNKHMPNGITSNILIKNQMRAYKMMHSLNSLKRLKFLRSFCSFRICCSSAPNQNSLFFSFFLY